MGSLEEEILLQMVNDFIELGSSPTRGTTIVTPDHDEHTKCYILQEIVESRSGVENRVVGSVLKHMRDKMKCEKSYGGLKLKKWLVKRLRMDGFSASLCHSSWPTTLTCPGGAYEYIEAVVEAKHRGPIRLIIDIDFKSQFEVARPTPSYKRLLHILPQIFVGEEDKLRRTLSILCSEAKCSLRQNGLHIPPWRTATYMHSKWLSSTITNFELPDSPVMLKLTHAASALSSAQFSSITTQTCC